MSAILPVIDEWERLGLKWRYVHNPKVKAFTVPPNNKWVEITPAVYKNPEGVMIFYVAAFDSPFGGVVMRWGPNFDSGNLFIINNLASLPHSDPLVYAILPPYTPPGTYVIRIASPWKWTKSMNLYVINSDTVPHTCIAFAYMLAVLEEPRPGPTSKGGA